MKKLISITAFLLFSFFLNAQTPTKGPLDGKTFNTTITEDGKKKPLDPDELKFQNGKFKSSLFVDWGFAKASVYEVTEVDSTKKEAVVYSWTAELANDAGERMVWSGSITNDDMDGSAELLNKKGSVKKKFTYTAVLKKKPGQKK